MVPAGRKSNRNNEGVPPEGGRHLERACKTPRGESVLARSEVYSVGGTEENPGPILEIMVAESDRIQPPIQRPRKPEKQRASSLEDKGSGGGKESERGLEIRQTPERKERVRIAREETRGANRESLEIRPSPQIRPGRGWQVGSPSERSPPLSPKHLFSGRKSAASTATSVASTGKSRSSPGISGSSCDPLCNHKSTSPPGGSGRRPWRPN